jgi:S-DNA-T family DNA segregation ATPase FtsK/SpoIIIE
VTIHPPLKPTVNFPKQEIKKPSDYVPPPASIFQRTGGEQGVVVNAKELENTATLLVKTFEDFGVLGKIIGYQPGPVVTVYEYQPDAGVKQSKIQGLIDDLALALKVDSIFILPVKGKRALGVQVPNSKRETVHFGDVVSTSIFRDSESPLTFGMGKSINGLPMCADLAAMPHLLVAGATGSGKSVGINSFLCSIIMKSKPEDVRMILVDPKMLELSVYEGIPHLLMPVITEPTRASLALRWAANEMERRYKLMQHACVRNLAGFNAFWEKAPESRREELREAAGDINVTKLPYIVLVIDELADLMMTAPKDVESSIQRLAQKARASGIHMVLATQRPSVDIITGVIKANLPCRIAFQVVSKHDSRTILDLIGAEKLLGKGDMLLQRPGIGRLERIQGAFITDEEVLNLVATVKSTSQVEYDEDIINWIDEEAERQKDSGKDFGDSTVSMDDDPKYDEAINIGRMHGVISASFLQRHLKIGYNRAARIVEFMESQGLVDKAEGAKPRKWLGPVS